MTNVFHGLKKALSLINSNTLFLSIIVVFISNIVGVINDYQNLTFFSIVHELLTDKLHFTILQLLIFFNIIKISNDMKNLMAISRYKDYFTYLKTLLKNIIVFVIFILIVDLFFNIVIACLRSNFDFTLVYHEFYDIPLLIYLLFFILREFIIIVLISTIVFELYSYTKNTIVKIAIFLIPVISFFYNPRVIKDLFKIPLLYSAYLTNVIYSNIFIEITGSIIQIFILSFVIIFIEHKLKTSKRDLIWNNIFYSNMYTFIYYLLWEECFIWSISYVFYLIYLNQKY